MLRWLTSEARVKLALLLGMQLLLALLANRIFDRFMWPFVLLTAIMMAVVAVTESLRPAIRLISVVIAIGAVTALCSWWSGGALVNLQLAAGVRQLITTEWPSPATPEAVATVGLVLAIIDALSSEAALRRDLHLLPLLPIGLGAVGATALSAPTGPTWAAWIAGSVLAILFAVIHHGTPIRTRTQALASERSLVVSVAVLAIAGVIGTMAVPDDERSNPRQLQEPSTSAVLLDPIEATIAMRESEPTIDLFALENRSSLSGPAMPSFWRMTALSDYDGQRWQPNSALRPIGYRLSNLPDGANLTRAPLSYRITPLTAQLDVLPFPGQPLTVSANVNTDVDRVVVQLRDDPEPNSMIEASALIQPNRGDVGNNRIATRPVDDLAASFTDIATELAGDGNDIERLNSLETTMRENWSLDPTSPGSGQQFALLNRFIRETQRGTREQFAAAFVLLARSLGYEARIASGFVVPVEQSGPNAVLNTSLAAVWPEVLVDNVGWIRFEPTPAQTSEQTENEEPQQQPQSPAAPQPPIAPPQEQLDRGESPQPENPSPSGRFEALRRIAVSVLAYSSIFLGPVLLAIGVVLGFKAFRRWHRLRTTDPTARIRAAWANSTDAFVDAGLKIPRSATNLQIAESANPLAPAAPEQLQRLAEMSTDVTFGTPADDDEMADSAVDMSRVVSAAVAENLGRWQRWRWRLSLRSIRPGTRSPVVP